MTKSKQKAEEVIKALKKGERINDVIARLTSSTEEWHNVSSSAYHQSFLIAEKRRKLDEKRPHVSVATNAEINRILELNNKIADYALLFPILGTNSDSQDLESLKNNLPNSEELILNRIAKLTMHPRFRVQQKKGRFEQFDPFKPFVDLIDAAVICYFRANFISCYFTLTPIIEGVMLRWQGYTPGDDKPEFEDLRKFFSIGHRRQPCPNNIMFHKVFSNACDKILNQHLYLPSTNGNPHNDFNRHIASHLLNDNKFATKSNCIRLFMLLDTMSELYVYEQKINDPRFNINDHDIKEEIELLINTILSYSDKNPEHILLGSKLEDLI
jgi:hypothetical protein